MEGREPKHIRARFSDIYQPALLTNWKIWPAAQVCHLMLHVFGTLLTRDVISLSISASCPYHIVSRFSKHAAFSGPCTCPSLIPRKLSFLPIFTNAELMRDIGRMKSQTQSTLCGIRWSNSL